MTRKVRFYPNEAQKILIKKHFGAHRYFYNKTVKFLRANPKTKLNWQEIRSNVYTKFKDIDKSNKEYWIIEGKYYCDVLRNAIRSCVAMHKSARTNYQRGYCKKKPKIKMLKKKDDFGVFHCPRNFLKDDLSIFVNKLKKKDRKLNMKNKDRNWMIKNAKKYVGEFSILREGNGNYYICLTRKMKGQKLKQKEHMVSLDPGVRTFQTFFSDHSYGEIGKNVIKDKISKLQRRIDHLESIKKEVKSKTRNHIKRRILLLKTKITNTVKDMHWKASNFLTKRYKCILIPIFRSKNMAENSNNKWLNRNMMTLSHFKFRERLIHKAKMTGTKVIVCKENWTSKTCTNCGKINGNLGSEKVYCCNDCGLVIDRDMNGARNIFIRCLTKYFNKK